MRILFYGLSLLISSLCFGQTLYALRFIKPIAPFRYQFAYQDSFLEVAKKNH